MQRLVIRNAREAERSLGAITAERWNLTRTKYTTTTAGGGGGGEGEGEAETGKGDLGQTASWLDRFRSGVSVSVSVEESRKEHRALCSFLASSSSSSSSSSLSFSLLRQTSSHSRQYTNTSRRHFGLRNSQELQLEKKESHSHASEEEEEGNKNNKYDRRYLRFHGKLAKQIYFLSKTEYALWNTVELAKERLGQEEVCAVISCFYKFYSRERKLQEIQASKTSNKRHGGQRRRPSSSSSSSSSSSFSEVFSFLPKKKQKALLAQRQKGFQNVLDVVEVHAETFDPVGIACFMRGMGVFKQEIPKPILNKLLERFVQCLNDQQDQDHDKEDEDEDEDVDKIKIQNLHGSKFKFKMDLDPEAEAEAETEGVMHVHLNEDQIAAGEDGEHAGDYAGDYVTAEHISDILESCRRRYGMPKMCITNRLLEELLTLRSLREKDLEVVVRALGKNGNVDQVLMARVVSTLNGIKIGRG